SRVKVLKMSIAVILRVSRGAGNRGGGARSVPGRICGRQPLGGRAARAVGVGDRAPWARRGSTLASDAVRRAPASAAPRTVVRQGNDGSRSTGCCFAALTRQSAAP